MKNDTKKLAPNALPLRADLEEMIRDFPLDPIFQWKRRFQN